MRPSVGRIRPEMTLKSVLLPQPEGPTSETNSPSRTSSEVEASAGVDPKAWRTFSTWSLACCIGFGRESRSRRVDRSFQTDVRAGPHVLATAPQAAPLGDSSGRLRRDFSYAASAR